MGLGVLTFDGVAVGLIFTLLTDRVPSMRSLLFLFGFGPSSSVSSRCLFLFNIPWGMPGRLAMVILLTGFSERDTLRMLGLDISKVNDPSWLLFGGVIGGRVG